MSYYTRASVERFKKDIEAGRPHSKCGTQLRYVGTGRSVWDGVFSCSGSGEVRNVAEIYCPTCDGEKDAPEYGAPINERDIVELI